MTRSAFLGIIVSVFILAAPGLVSAARETVSPPNNLTDKQKDEWKIGAYSGWLQLCGYRSKSSQISSFMKKSPYFRKGETEMLKFDAGAGCTSSNERLNELLRDKDQWERYLDDTYTPQPKLSVGPYDGLWTGLGESEGGNCKYLGLGRSFFAFELEIMVREQEIKGRIKGLRTFNWRHFFADVSIQGTVSENGEFDLQVGKANFSDKLVLRGKLPEESDLANGKWNTPYCHGKLTLNRDYRTY